MLPKPQPKTLVIEIVNGFIYITISTTKAKHFVNECNVYGELIVLDNCRYMLMVYKIYNVLEVFDYINSYNENEY